MPAGDRYIDGKPKDIVRHYAPANGGLPICLNKRYGYSSNDVSETNCIKCLSKLKKLSK